jgi:hypothetical protein
MRHFVIPVAALLALPACAGKVSATGSSTTTSVGSGGSTSQTSTGGTGGTGLTGGTSGTGGGLPACDEPGMVPGSGTVPGYMPFACKLPMPCPSVHFYSGTHTGWDAGAPSFYDPAAATCVLKSLRDRTVSTYVVRNHEDGINQFYTDETVFIVDDAHAFSNWESVQDLDISSGTKNRQLLKPPAYFDGCLQLTDPTAIWQCMSDWSAGCDTNPVACPGG